MIALQAAIQTANGLACVQHHRLYDHGHSALRVVPCNVRPLSCVDVMRGYMWYQMVDARLVCPRDILIYKLNRRDTWQGPLAPSGLNKTFITMLPCAFLGTPVRLRVALPTADPHSAANQHNLATPDLNVESPPTSTDAAHGDARQHNFEVVEVTSMIHHQDPRYRFSYKRSHHQICISSTSVNHAPRTYTTH